MGTIMKNGITYGGGGASELLVTLTYASGTYSVDKTFAEIEANIAAGGYPILKFNTLYYPMTIYTSGSAVVFGGQSLSRKWQCAIESDGSVYVQTTNIGASGVDYSNTSSGLSATDVQSAIDENAERTNMEYYGKSTLLSDYVTLNSSVVNTSHVYNDLQCWDRGIVANLQMQFVLQSSVANDSTVTLATLDDDIVDILGATTRRGFAIVEGGTYGGRLLIGTVDTWSSNKKSQCITV